jgi:hypothetical protein
MQLKIVCNLGSPAADCANFGVCDVVIMSAIAWEQFVPTCKCQVKALLSLNELKDLEFYFPESSMLTLTKVLFFLTPEFQVDAPLTLKPNVCSLLGIAKGSQLLAGMYPITVTSEGFGVSIGCTIQREMSQNVQYCL